MKKCGCSVCIEATGQLHSSDVVAPACSSMWRGVWRAGATAHAAMYPPPPAEPSPSLMAAPVLTLDIMPLLYHPSPPYPFEQALAKQAPPARDFKAAILAKAAETGETPLCSSSSSSST